MASPRALFPYSRSRGRHPVRAAASQAGPLSGWTSSLVPRYLSERQRMEVSNRALDLYTNDSIAHGVLEALVVETIGTGITASPATRYERVGRDAEWGDLYKGAAFRCWEGHGLDFRNFCDATRRLNIYGLQALAFFSWKLSGIGLFQKVFVKGPGRKLGQATLPIDPERLATPSNRQSAEIYDGIEVDSNGAPVAIHLRKPGVTSAQPSIHLTDRFELYDRETGLPRIYLVCDVRNIAEYRQDSILGTIAPEIYFRKDMQLAFLIGQAVRNNFVAFVQDYGGSTISKDTPWRERVQETSKGTFLLGGKNEKPHFFNHGNSAVGLKEVNDAVTTDIGIGTGRGAENVKRQYQQSYSASKANMEKSDQFCDYEREIVMVNRFCQPEYAWMTYESCLRGELPGVVKKDFLPNLYEYTRCRHLPQPTRHLDKDKQSKANERDRRNGFLLLEEVWGEKGLSSKEAMRRFADEIMDLKRLSRETGVDLVSLFLGGEREEGDSTINDGDKDDD
ncbi:phage portal protein [Pseudodesulfovibrio thermohalotolerans]|uniref:phage portal protein n=1 Tax=Pseudodesulfovibrio thermohalotolerans TaxID=2880651 RepID=UPI0024426C88|nr:phage portal protein [Pseudodesulfovibrio thermohalotolerans]WFS63448.1 phage portal protein [Pseudodesulfovibrio thermohalotolerans]